MFNNGITIISTETEYRKLAGQRGKAGLIVTNPQIINGGQTAYTLNKIYEERKENEDKLKVFDKKEVLVKIITFTSNNEINNNPELISEISKTTNQQSPINDADKVANSPIFLEMQKIIFENHGYFYERKRGEFYDGLKNGYIKKEQVIQRENLFRIAYASIGQPAQSRTISTQKIFTTKYKHLTNDKNRFELYVFGYECYIEIERLIEENKNSDDKYRENDFGNAFRFATYALIAATIKRFYNNISINNFSMKTAMEDILKDWKDFENKIIKYDHNKKYFREVINENGEKILHTNFNGYYRGTTLNGDIHNYFNNNQ